MKEPEVSLRIAMKYIESSDAAESISVSVDEAFIWCLLPVKEI